MLAQITIPQIIHINEAIADYVFSPSTLTNNDQFFDAYVTKDMPQSQKLALGSWCKDNRLFCTFSYYQYEGTYGYRIAVWSYDYTPRYTIGV